MSDNCAMDQTTPPSIQDIMKREKEAREYAHSLECNVMDAVANHIQYNGKHATCIVMSITDHGLIMRYKSYMLSNFHDGSFLFNGLKVYRTSDIEEGEIKVF